MNKGSLFENVTLVSLSGTIGAGKSVAIARLRESGYVQQELGDDVDVVLVREPSEKWRKHGWTPAFYKAPKDRALAFQFLIFTTHVRAVEKAILDAREAQKELGDAASPRPIVCIVERCMWDQLLFWKVQGSDPMDDDAYMQVWKRWDELLPPVSIIFFFKTTNLQTTMERVVERGIEEEKDMSIEYQTALFEKHTSWYPEGGYTHIEYKDGKHLRVVSSVKCVHVNTDSPYRDKDEALRGLARTLAQHLKAIV